LKIAGDLNHRLKRITQLARIFPFPQGHLKIARQFIAGKGFVYE
jgi:hypothetical protein